jgi:arylsulfatase A-like enzyme
MIDRRLFLASAAGSLAVSRAPGQPRKRPNFIFILADDLGYGDLGCYGASGYATPHLDRMAAEGARFTNYYAPACVCTPTRSAIMTGCYPMRVGLGHRVLFPYSTTGLHPEEITVAETLRGAGYRTGCIGKWHLGHLPKFLPRRQGFDFYFGVPYSNDMHQAGYEQLSFKAPPLPLYRNDDVIERGPDQSLLTRRYTEQAIEFIRASREQPFFLYLAHNMPHTPIYPSDKFAGTTRHGRYGDVVSELDWGVGEILAELRRLNLDPNTLVMFASDNGGVVWEGTDGRGYRSSSSGPLRGAKATTWEGGVRSPFIARWPERIPRALTSNEIASGMDILPTLAGLAGAPVPAGRMIDGKDMWPLLSGASGARSAYESFYYFTNDAALAAVRSGRWKLHVSVPERFQASGDKAPLLYDLESDPGESRNIAREHPDIVRRLQAIAAKAREDLGDESLRQLGRGARTIGRTP